MTGSYLYGVSMPATRTLNGAVVVAADPIYIDAEDEYCSTWTRFLNHASSLGKNNLNPKSIHESYNGQPRVWFIANRNIEPGEELCFDYGDDYWLPQEHVV
jgi:SET domain